MFSGFLLTVMVQVALGEPPAPEMIHLAYGQTEDQMVIMWTTATDAASDVIISGGKPGVQVVAAPVKHIWYIKGASAFVHTVEVSGLISGNQYTYRVGDARTATWSSNRTFNAKVVSLDWEPSIAIYGDFGVSNAQSLGNLVSEVKHSTIDFVLHNGDLAYDMRDDGGRNGLQFMRQIEPIASSVPYMVSIGNHEGGTDYDHVSSLYQYMHMFQMPGKWDGVHMSKGNSVYYSFDAGPAHFIVFSSEVYFWQLWDLEAQYAWIKADLEKIDRARTPWVITMAHRPMYCSNSGADDCAKTDSAVRTGVPMFGTRFFRLEELFNQHSVDVAFWAHEHSYERTWPVYDNTVLNGTSSPYTDPRATVHIIAGAAGCKEEHNPFGGPRGNWSAFRSEEYGYGKLKATKQALHWTQYSVTGAVVDNITVTKSKNRFVPAPSKIAERGAQSQYFAEQKRVYATSAPCTERLARVQDGCINPALSPSIPTTPRPESFAV